MPPRRKTIDATTVDPNKPISMTIFGWCSTNHHENCVESFTGHQCSCNCHEVDESPTES